jgi:predicted AAA+ superfamily ATPase
MDNKQKLTEYVSDQLNRAEVRARAYVVDPSGKKRARRSAYVPLKKYLDEFIDGANRQNRWIAISGLRGTGKTTLLAQLYCDLDVDKQRKLFVSADHAVQLLGSDITELVQMYEVLSGSALERADEPVFLFIDEVQYDPKWAIALKSIYDRAPNVFIISTGSSALELNANPDTARRVITETLLPMSFSEYQAISNRIAENGQLGDRLRRCLRQAVTAKDVFDGFEAENAAINRYWTKVDRLEVGKYLQYGTLPFMAATGNPSLAFDQLERSIDRILGSDVTKIGQFSADVVARIPQVLYSVADSDLVSLNSMSNALDIPRPTLTRVFRALEQAEVLYRLAPHTSHMAQNRQPDKYLFTTPAVRAMYYALTGSIRSAQQVQGKLLEDAAGLYLRRLYGVRSIGTSITYPTQKGAADFVVNYRQTTFVIEVGSGRKNFRQIEQTPGVPAKRIGVVLANDQLAVNEEKNIVTIPIRQFLLA